MADRPSNPWPRGHAAGPTGPRFKYFHERHASQIDIRRLSRVKAVSSTAVEAIKDFPLTDVMMFKLLSRFRKPAPPGEERPLVVLGSSSSEAFDYVFGDNPQYFPFWASAWSARGLRTKQHRDYLRAILAPIPRGATILLNFGCTDVNFNCRHMAASRGHYDFKAVIEEAAEGIRMTDGFLKHLGFDRNHAVFISPAMSLPQSYWNIFSKSRQLPDKMLGRMYHDLFRLTARDVPTIDLFAELSGGEKGHYLLRTEFMRPRPNHHPDYIRMQHILWDKIRHLEGMLPMREPPFQEEYPHVQSSIKTLLEKHETRPRTCR